MKLINIGFGNMVNASRMVVDSQPRIRPDKANHPGVQGEVP